MRSKRLNNPWWAPFAFGFVGLALAAVGGWYVVWHHTIEAAPERVIGTVIDSGHHVSNRSATTRWVQYQFQDHTSKLLQGRSAGYSGVVGESIALEYARQRPGFHRVAGEGYRPATRWRWAILGVGLVFLVAELQAGWVTLRRARR